MVLMNVGIVIIQFMIEVLLAMALHLTVMVAAMVQQHTICKTIGMYYVTKMNAEFITIQIRKKETRGIIHITNMTAIVEVSVIKRVNVELGLILKAGLDMVLARGRKVVTNVEIVTHFMSTEQHLLLVKV